MTEDETPKVIPKLGDMNLDGELTEDDVDWLETALDDPAKYEDEFGLNPLWAGDMKQDGVLTEKDLNKLERLIEGLPGNEIWLAGNEMDEGDYPGEPLVPEPSTLTLLLLGGILFMNIRNRLF